MSVCAYAGGVALTDRLAYLQNQLHFVRRHELEEREDAERCSEFARDAIVEHAELAVGRNERQRARRVELVEAYALVEVAIIEHDVPVA